MNHMSNLYSTMRHPKLLLLLHVVGFGILCWLQRHNRLLDLDDESSYFKTVRDLNAALKDHESEATPCSQQKRLTQIQEYCDQQVKKGDPTLLVDLKKEKIAETFLNFYVIPEKRLLMCIPFKAGSTTWQTIIGKNFLTEEQKNGRRDFVAAKDTHLSKALNTTSETTVEEVLDTIKDYYKILLVRHPFDGMASVEHSLLNGPTLFKGLKDIIRERYHPEIDASHLYPRGTFNITDLLRYIKDDIKLYANRHYTPNYMDCLPCQIKYDYMAKIETQVHDSEFIVNQKMNGIAADTHVNVVRPNKSDLAKDGKKLEIFQSVPSDLMDFAVDYFKHDLPLYGYQFDSKTLVAKCVNEDVDKHTCC